MAFLLRSQWRWRTAKSKQLIDGCLIRTFWTWIFYNHFVTDFFFFSCIRVYGTKQKVFGKKYEKALKVCVRVYVRACICARVAVHGACQLSSAIMGQAGSLLAVWHLTENNAYSSFPFTNTHTDTQSGSLWLSCHQAVWTISQGRSLHLYVPLFLFLALLFKSFLPSILLFLLRFSTCFCLPQTLWLFTRRTFCFQAAPVAFYFVS